MVSQLFTTGVVRRLRRLERATEDARAGRDPGRGPERARRDRPALGATARHHRPVARAGRGTRPRPGRAREHPHRQSGGVAALRRRHPALLLREPQHRPALRDLGRRGRRRTGAHPGTPPSRLGRPAARRARRRTRRAAANASRSLLRFRRDPTSRTGGKPRPSTPWNGGPTGSSRGSSPTSSTFPSVTCAQRAADERRFLLESIFHASPDTIVVRDISGQVVLGSSPLADVIGDDRHRARRRRTVPSSTT